MVDVLERNRAAAGHTGGSGGFEAVIFDMDGVITDTASAHSAAWKRMFDEYLRGRAEKCGTEVRPFIHEDYLKYLDGVPRHDGIARFLESRGITLPWGQEDDPPERESVCGLGNRKNRYFREWLETDEVKVFADSVPFIKALKRSGIKCGIFSSSRNGEEVLKSTGLIDLFDAWTDGRDGVRLGLRGKPKPDLLIETARRLGCDPRHTAAVEDAVSGVEAAAAGRFALVIGVNRSHEEQPSLGSDLRANGADLVTRDLRRLLYDGGGVSVRTARNPDAVKRFLAGLAARHGEAAHGEAAM